MPFDRDTFGPYLRHARERRSITLDDIAGRTKIARSLLAKLERGDLSDWPSGIFRRSFFREYVGAIGLDADALMDEFLRLFPDPTSDVPPTPTRADLRLTLDAVPASRLSAGNVRRAFIDIAIIAVVAAVMSLATGHTAVVFAAVALLYHGVSTALGGATGAAVVVRDVASTQSVEAPAVAQEIRPRPETRRSEPARRPARPRRRVDGPGVVRTFPQRS